MKPAAFIPREIVQRKPRHGAACTRCGVCCLLTLCEIGRAVYGREHGPCPSLRWNGPESRCALTEIGTLALNHAALVLTRAGQGCDCRINGEPRNEPFDAALDRHDEQHAGEIAAARKLWGLD